MQNCNTYIEIEVSQAQNGMGERLYVRGISRDIIGGNCPPLFNYNGGGVGKKKIWNYFITVIITIFRILQTSV